MTTATVKTKSKSAMSPLTLVYSGMFAALMMIGANITAFVPFLVVGNVPITLQTFFAILAGLILGSRRGALAMTVYMFIGLAGAPVFARFSGGFGSIISPTFGFIVSFILVAFIAGKIVEKNGKESIISFAEGDEQRMLLMGLKRFVKYTNYPDIVDLRRG